LEEVRRTKRTRDLNPRAKVVAGRLGSAPRGCTSKQAKLREDLQNCSEVCRSVWQPGGSGGSSSKAGAAFPVSVSPAAPAGRASGAASLLAEARSGCATPGRSSGKGSGKGRRRRERKSFGGLAGLSGGPPTCRCLKPVFCVKTVCPALPKPSTKKVAAGGHVYVGPTAPVPFRGVKAPQRAITPVCAVVFLDWFRRL